MPGIGALWDSLVDCICRPPRDEYIYPDELVGGRRGLFRVGRYPGIREDLTLVNKRGSRLQCSHYFPRHVRGRDGRLPCVLYCHCNSGSRRDAEEAICVLIPIGVSVFTLDFAGSGLSDGQWVTLGSEEVEDVQVAVEHLRAGGRVSTLGLWGRSMGAVTALLFSQRDHSIAGMVLDSPFSRLTDLMLEIVAEQRLPIPRPLAKLALAAMRRSVTKRAGFDITKVNPVDVVPQSFTPALFGHATGDTFIRISHAEALHAAYAGDKNLIRFDGDHNSRRPQFFYNSVAIFWHNTLQLEHLLEPADVTLSPGPVAAPLAASLDAAAATAATGAGLPATPPSSLPTAAITIPTTFSPLPAGRPLRPPAQPSATHAAAAAAAAGGSSAADGTPSPSAAVAAGGGGDGDDGAMDVAAPGGAARSAPWEPRMWEWELDRSERERQRFRRMAGGLSSPPGNPSNHSASSTGSASTAATGAGASAGGAYPLSPLGGVSVADVSALAAAGNGNGNGYAAGGGNGGGYPNSAELAHLLANASDYSVVARLLGEDPNWSDGGGPDIGDGDGGVGGWGPDPRVGPGYAGGGAFAGTAGLSRMLPGSAEEEEEQLRAALELSLLEAAAAATATEAAGDGGERQPGRGSKAAAEAADAEAAPLLPPPPPPHLSSSSLSSPGAATGTAGGGGAALLAAVGRQDDPSRPPSFPQQQQQQQYSQHPPPRLPPLPADYRPQQDSDPSAAAAGGGGDPFHCDPHAALLNGGQRYAGGSGGSPATATPLAYRQSPAATAAQGAAGFLRGPVHGAVVAAGTLGAGGYAASSGSGGAAAAPGSGAGGLGPSLYDMCTDDELLALAVQLSLQEGR